MPHFNAAGLETWICQCCGMIFDTNVESQWRPEITGNKHAGNACPKCIADKQPKPGDTVAYTIDHVTTILSAPDCTITKEAALTRVGIILDIYPKHTRSEICDLALVDWKDMIVPQTCGTAFLRKIA